MLLETGYLIGEYRIIEVIGDGGFSVVYKAEDTQLERWVAIKQLNPDAFAEYATAERFKREARLAASLNHPHIVSTYALRQEGDLLFLIMEYMPGGSVRDLIERYGFLAPGTVVKLAAHVCHALEALHMRGIIHRDIKPENILCTADGDFKLADFGLAHNARVEPRQRAAGPQSGTLHYMSPEQALGHELTPASDIYSLATVLYEALSGRYYLPILDEAEMIDSITSLLPVFLSSYSAALDVFDAPLMRALAKNPAERPLSARLFFDEIRNASKRRRAAAPPPELEHELHTIRVLRDVLNEPEQALARLDAPWVRDADYPEVSAERGETLIALGNVNGGASLIRQAVTSKPALPFAQMALARIYEEAGQTPAYEAALVTAISADADLVFATYYETLHNAIRDTDRFWRWIGLFQRATASGGAVVYFNLGRAIALVKGYEHEAIACFEQAIVIAPNMGPLYVALGGVWIGLGNFEQAISLLTHATTLEFTIYTDEDWPKKATAYQRWHAYLGLAMAYLHLKQYATSADAAAEAIRLAPGDATLHAEGLLDHYVNAASGWLHAGNLADAYDLLIRAVPLAEVRADPRIGRLMAQIETPNLIP